MWLKAKDINEAINKASTKIVNKINIDDIAESVADKICYQFSERIVYGFNLKEEIKTKIVNAVVANMQQQIIDSISNEEFNELIRQGIKDKIKESTSGNV